MSVPPTTPDLTSRPPFLPVDASSGFNMLTSAQGGPNWIAELNRVHLFEGFGFQFFADENFGSTVDALLAFAYETRDLHIAELFLMERLHRRTILALDLQKTALLGVRARITQDYSELNWVKEVLNDKGYADKISKYTSCRECPGGHNLPPCDFAFIYNSPDGQPLVKPPTT